MIRIAICDDEKEVAVSLQKQIQADWEDCIVTSYTDASRLLLDISTYDLIFLDIDMPNMDGITLGKNIREQNQTCALVYVTSYSDYRSMAFGVHAFDYLEKPIQPDAIHRVLQEFIQYYQKEETLPECVFETKEGIFKVPQEAITYIEFAGRKCHVHTEKQELLVACSLVKMKEQLSDFFVMPHKSFYVNLQKVQLVKGYCITLTSGEELPLSQKKSVQFRKELNAYLMSCLEKRHRK